mmetsp:Transcript_12167/g.22000  ORF Transcript_12167/g.22000 Transcript_12167/m.22000 type:complete len:246 (-) Transcript_12167:1829-2566(-)
MMDTVSDVLIGFIPDACSNSTASDFFQDLTTNTQCFSACLSTILGTLIILFATVIKVPQVVKICKEKSGEGLSLTAMLVEQFGYLYNIATFFREKYAFSTYGDLVTVMIQNMVILFLVLYFEKKKVYAVLLVSGLSIVFAFMCSDLFPIEILRVLISLNVPVVLMSRVPQIISNFKTKSTGALSPATSVGLLVGSCVRVFTTYVNVPDTTILIGYIASATTHIVVVTQILLYRPTAQTEKHEKKE